MAPRRVNFYAQTPAGQQRQPVLDLCCGTGLLARGFLEAGHSVTGLGDAAEFALDGHFGLVVATYDALNHLPNLAALRGCLRSVSAPWRLAAGSFST